MSANFANSAVETFEIWRILLHFDSFELSHRLFSHLLLSSGAVKMIHAARATQTGRRSTYNRENMTTFELPKMRQSAQLPTQVMKPI